MKNNFHWNLHFMIACRVTACPLRLRFGVRLCFASDPSRPSALSPARKVLQTRSQDLVLQLPCRDDHHREQSRLQRDAQDRLCYTEAGFDVLELNITAQLEFVLEA